MSTGRARCGTTADERFAPTVRAGLCPVVRFVLLGTPLATSSSSSTTKANAIVRTALIWRRRRRAFCRASLMSSSPGSELSYGASCSVGVIIIETSCYASWATSSNGAGRAENEGVNLRLEAVSVRETVVERIGPASDVRQRNDIRGETSTRQAQNRFLH